MVIKQSSQWQATPVLLPRKSHGWRSLVGCSPWGRYESDATERLHFHFSLSHNGEGNGSPLQCSCLENPRDGRAWWAAICGAAQSWTPLKRLSSNNVMSSGLLPTLLPSNSIQITLVFQLQPHCFQSLCYYHLYNPTISYQVDLFM